MGGHKLVLVLGDGWEAIYVDGKSFAQEHNVQFYLIDAINEFNVFPSARKVVLNSEGIRWCESNGCLPDQLSDIDDKYFE
jgi:hypothetical protein